MSRADAGSPTSLAARLSTLLAGLVSPIGISSEAGRQDRGVMIHRYEPPGLPLARLNRLRHRPTPREPCKTLRGLAIAHFAPTPSSDGDRAECRVCRC